MFCSAAILCFSASSAVVCHCGPNAQRCGLGDHLELGVHTISMLVRVGPVGMACFCFGAMLGLVCSG